jgi:hypothetical protein
MESENFPYGIDTHIHKGRDGCLRDLGCFGSSTPFKATCTYTLQSTTRDNKPAVRCTTLDDIVLPHTIDALIMHQHAQVLEICAQWWQLAYFP